MYPASQPEESQNLRRTEYSRRKILHTPYRSNVLLIRILQMIPGTLSENTWVDFYHFSILAAIFLVVSPVARRADADTQSSQQWRMQNTVSIQPDELAAF
jgi:hypothetical protein